MTTNPGSPAVTEHASAFPDASKLVLEYERFRIGGVPGYWFTRCVRCRTPLEDTPREKLLHEKWHRLIGDMPEGAASAEDAAADRQDW